MPCVQNDKGILFSFKVAFSLMTLACMKLAKPNQNILHWLDVSANPQYMPESQRKISNASEGMNLVRRARLCGKREIKLPFSMFFT